MPFIERAASEKLARATSRSFQRRDNQASVAAAKAAADRHAEQVMPTIEAIRADGVTSLRGIARELDQRGILTARGGRWNATRVRNLLERSAT